MKHTIKDTTYLYKRQINKHFFSVIFLFLLHMLTNKDTIKLQKCDDSCLKTQNQQNRI